MPAKQFQQMVRFRKLVECVLGGNNIMNEAKLDELNKLHDSGKLTDEDYHALVQQNPGLSKRTKKIILVSVICASAAIALLFVLINGVKPSDMTDGVYEAGKSAVSVVNDYKSGKITASTAASELDTLYDTAHSLSDSADDLNTRITDNNVASDLLYMRIDLEGVAAMPKTFDEYLSDLKKSLGMIL
jgi:hypothetical protein